MDDEEPFCVGSGRCFVLSEREEILKRAGAAWYITLIVSQQLHLLNIKATRISIFKHRFSNAVTYYAIALSLALAVLFVYVPGVNDIMGASPVGVEGWIPPLGVGLLIFLFSEWRQAFLRRSATAAHPSFGFRLLTW